MKSHPLHAAAMAAALLFGASTGVFAQTTTTTPATPGGAIVTDADDDAFDLGWLGLLGLIGLAGLSGRKRNHVATTVDPVGRPRV